MRKAKPDKQLIVLIVLSLPLNTWLTILSAYSGPRRLRTTVFRRFSWIQITVRNCIVKFLVIDLDNGNLEDIFAGTVKITSKLRWWGITFHEQ